RICSFFFFKHKTAYEFGLGIPAEPLFRSNVASPPAACGAAGAGAVKLIRLLFSKELIALGIHDLLAHRLRSFLTALGMIFGVAEIGRASCRERVVVTVGVIVVDTYTA